MPFSALLRRQRGATLGKVLLLLLFVSMAVAYWVWKDRYGIIGDVHPLDFSTKDHVAYLRQDRAGQTNLFVVKLDGTGERQLTQDADAKQGLTWSPDGTQLCYAAERKDENVPAYQLFLFGSKGGKQLTSGSGSKSMPEWRPDGAQIAFLLGGALKVVDPNGNNMEQVYPQMHKGGGGEDPDNEDSGQRRPPLAFFRWAPDSSAVAAVQQAEGEQAMVQGSGDWFKRGQSRDSPQNIVPEPETLLILPTGGAEPTIRPETNSTRVGFSWFPDGKRIAVTLSTRNNHGIAILRADEPRLPAAALFASASYTVSAENPTVSPDGLKIAFEVWRIDSAENRDLMGVAVLPTDSAQPVVVRSTADIAKVPIVVKGKTTNPIWSMDSKRIVYQLTDASGRRDLWCSNADGTGAVNLTNGKGDNFEAVSSPAKK